LNLFIVPMVGIVAAIAIPNFVKFGCRSKQSEAKGNLRALYVAEQSYRGEFDVFSDDAKAMGFEPRGVKLRYEYVIVSADKEHCVAEARAIAPEMLGELWRMDDSNKLEAITDSCR
jgi:type IV pilus assembly protein PilA